MARGGGGGGGRGRGKGRHSDQQSRETTISKAISFVLRHGAAKEGLKLDENGYANVADLVRCILSLPFLFFRGRRRGFHQHISVLFHVKARS